MSNKLQRRPKVTNILITGAGGFIGGHLVNYFSKKSNVKIRAVDIKPLSNWQQLNQKAENLSLDLKSLENCRVITRGIDEVYNLAADMGGMGFIENNKALCMLNVLINTHMLIAATQAKVKRFFYSSSACVYALDKQTRSKTKGLRESDAYPAMPEDGYGWEKLMMERACRHFMEDYGLPTYVARFHNIYGPLGTYDGGKEKSPAALCRKVATNSVNLDIWGNGEQTRSYCYIDDCIEGLYALMNSKCHEPVNIGTERAVSINELADIIMAIANKKLQKAYDVSKPQGVQARNADITKAAIILGWFPEVQLEEGIRRTYLWIKGKISQ